MNKSAKISKCGKYRYKLMREWDKELPKVMFLMLNPSTADAEKDDPTIRRCINFAKAWGYGGIYVCNLFAYRATKPKDLIKAYKENGFDYICGPKNHLIQSITADKCLICILAWGNNKLKIKQGSLVNISIPLCYLALTAYDEPAHPLMLKKDLVPIPFKTYNQ